MAGYGGRIGEGKGHRTKAELRTTKVEQSGTVERPALSPETDPQVLTWFDNWAKSPQAPLFTVTDWQRLVMLAPLVERYFLDPRPAILSEIRMNESLLGATVTDRLRAHIEVATSPTDVDTAAGADDELVKRRAGRARTVA